MPSVNTDMRTLLLALSLTGCLVLSACSGEDRADAAPIELPSDPLGTEALSAPFIETQVDTILLSAAEMSGTWVGPQRMLELVDTDRGGVLEHYDAAFAADGWEVVEDAAIMRSLGRTFVRDGQKVVISVLTMDGTDVALIFQSAEAD